MGSRRIDRPFFKVIIPLTPAASAFIFAASRARAEISKPRIGKIELVASALSASPTSFRHASLS